MNRLSHASLLAICDSAPQEVHRDQAVRLLGLLMIAQLESRGEFRNQFKDHPAYLAAKGAYFSGQQVARCFLAYRHGRFPGGGVLGVPRDTLRTLLDAPPERLVPAAEPSEVEVSAVIASGSAGWAGFAALRDEYFASLGLS